jgi:hypothetical protein
MVGKISKYRNIKETIPANYANAQIFITNGSPSAEGEALYISVGRRVYRKENSAPRTPLGNLENALYTMTDPGDNA